MIRWGVIGAAAASLMWSAAAKADVASGWRAYIDGQYDAAETEWRAPAARGDSGAAFGMAILEQTRGNLSEAAKWYEVAARAGMANAQVLLGAMYAEGRGVPQDGVRAYAWLDQAARQGHPKASLVREAVAASLTDAQIAEAENLSRSLGKSAQTGAN